MSDKHYANVPRPHPHMQRVLSIPFISCQCFDKNKQTHTFGYRNHWSGDSAVSQFGQPVFNLPSIFPQMGLLIKY